MEHPVQRSTFLRHWSESLRARAQRAKAQAQATLRHVQLMDLQRKWRRK
jgi:hypothetical protein